MKQAAIITLESGGQIRIEFYPQDAPKTVENFVTLARRGFYDGLVFHRVVPGFVVRAATPRATAPAARVTREGRVQCPQARAGLSGHGPQSGSRLGGQPVLHHVRRAAAPGRQLHGLRSGQLRHGARGRHPGRATG